MIERLDILKENRKQYANAQAVFDAFKNEAFKIEVTELASYFLGRKITGCKNCFFDAYMELINLSTEKAMGKENCQYELLAGALLQDPNGNTDKNVSNSNITNELAEYHLNINPDCVRFFQRMPEKVVEESTEQKPKISIKKKDLA